MLVNFINVLSYFLRYLFAVTEGKIEAKFLMSKEAKGKGASALEADLQNSILAFLLGTDIAFAVWPEQKMATGRADIALMFGEVVFPVEIKREKKETSENHLREMYLAQAATYTRAYSRLGIFVVLDLTEKNNGEPLADIENLVFLTEMQPRSGSTVRVPDYVVTCIVPGNQPRPSDMSSYS